jgi:hypothetical protein
MKTWSISLLLLLSASMACAQTPPHASHPAVAPVAPVAPVPPVPPVPPVAPVAPVAPLPPLPPLPPMAAADGPSHTAELAVKGPVTLRVHVISTDVEVVRGGVKTIKAQLKDSSGGLVLVDRGDHVDLAFRSTLPGMRHAEGIEGAVRVELPSGSNVEISSMQGDVHVLDVGGAVRVRSTSGDVVVRGAGAIEAMLVSGDANLEARGDVRLRTVSGDAKVVQAGGPASKLEFGSTNGDLHWTGACGAGCRIDARTMSGDLKLSLDPSSSFDLRYISHNGDLGDHLHTTVLESKTSDHGGGTIRSRLGKGEGVIEAQTFSGDLALERR